MGRWSGRWDRLTPPPTGALSSSQALWEQPKHWNELIRSTCDFTQTLQADTLLLTHVHLACIFFILAFNQPPNQLSWFQTPPIVSISPSEVSGCLCTLRYKGKILISSSKVAWCDTSLYFLSVWQQACSISPLNIHPLFVTSFLHLQLFHWRMIGLYGGRSQFCASAYFSPDQECWDVPDWHVACESFDSQIAVVREQDHLPA